MHRKNWLSGKWIFPYAESLVDDMMFLQAAYKMCNRNPLGSAAGYVEKSGCFTGFLVTRLFHTRSFLGTVE